jgi:acyl carrier protein
MMTRARRFHLHDKAPEAMASVTEIVEEVFRVTLTPRGTVIRPEQKLIADLKLLSDDATSMAIDLERRFHVKIPSEDWSTVLTVQDVINLLTRHAA